MNAEHIGSTRVEDDIDTVLKMLGEKQPPPEIDHPGTAHVLEVQVEMTKAPVIRSKSKQEKAPKREPFLAAMKIA